jgi:hypothetical protein
LCSQTSTIKKIPLAAHANDDDHGNFYSIGSLTWMLAMTTKVGLLCTSFYTKRYLNHQKEEE